jgi:hypothetical protein
MTRWPSSFPGQVQLGLRTGLSGETAVAQRVAAAAAGARRKLDLVIPGAVGHPWQEMQAPLSRELKPPTGPLADPVRGPSVPTASVRGRP